MQSQTNRFFLKRFFFIFSGILFSFLLVVGVSATNRNPVADFDGDGKTDISVFRPSNGFWYVSKSSGGFSSIPWGLSNDQLAPGDYDGDGKTDLAVYRSNLTTSTTIDSNVYYILRSSDNTFVARPFGSSVNSGNGFAQGARVVPADYDGDGRTDLAIYATSDFLGSATFFTILESSTGKRVVTHWGRNSDALVPADYDGDGRADYTAFREGVWYILQSSNGAVRREYFGFRPNFSSQADLAVSGDYDGDGKLDIAVWRPSDGYWYYISSRNKSFNSYQFGLSDDKPVPGDYDGDGKTDFAVFRPSNGVWYLQQSTKGFRAEQFGLSTDTPIPSVFVR